MSLPAPTTALPDRRVDLDWLRIAAFGLLIFYHVGMFYVTWDFHVKSSRASSAIEPLMLILNPWRLTLLFVISGVATRFMMDKMKPGRFLGARASRLLIPLIFGVFVIVPPQTYMQVIEALGYSGSFTDFYQKYATASGHWRINGEPLITPTYNHLWFVAYLFIYTALILAVGPLARRIPAKLAAPLISGPGLFVLPFAFLYIARVTLFPIYGETHALVDDWYNHLVSFGGFLFGYAVAKHERFFEACQKHRFLALGLAVVGYAIFATGRATNGFGLALPEARLAVSFGRELQAWCAILACFGFARTYLRHDGPARRYLTDAIFPFYIIHQTTIVLAGPWLDKQHLPLWLEAATLIGLTATSCVVTYEIARRVPLLRPLFGLKMERREKRISAPMPALRLNDDLA